MQIYNFLLLILQDELETDKLINIYKIGENIVNYFIFKKKSWKSIFRKIIKNWKIVKKKLYLKKKEHHSDTSI